MSTAEETRHVQYISIAEHPTRSVTIYPKSATIVREILGVNLKVAPLRRSCCILY